jgi:hypothetical protein
MTIFDSHHDLIYQFAVAALPTLIKIGNSKSSIVIEKLVEESLIAIIQNEEEDFTHTSNLYTPGIAAELLGMIAQQIPNKFLPFIDAVLNMAMKLTDFGVDHLLGNATKLCCPLVNAKLNVNIEAFQTKLLTILNNILDKCKDPEIVCQAFNNIALIYSELVLPLDQIKEVADRILTRN